MNDKLTRIFILITMLAALASLANAEIIVSRENCTDGLTFVIENTGQYRFRPMDFKIVGIHNSGKTLLFDGIWRNLGEQVGSRTSGMQFLSNNSMPYYGDYVINVTRIVQDENHLINGKPEITFSESTEFKVTCEEQAFECSKVNLKIDDCYSVNGNFYSVLSGIGKQIEFNPYKRFNIKISSRSELINNETPQDVSMGEVDAGRYYISFPHIGKAWATMNINGCDVERYGNTYTKRECNFARECTDDSECGTNEYCNTDKQGVCEQVICTECERPNNHTCLPKCSDNNACTNDICIEGSCSQTIIPNCCQTAVDCGQNTICNTNLCINNRCDSSAKVCNETSDECIIGSCDDEKGCTYTIDDSCRIGWLQRIINWITGFFR